MSKVKELTGITCKEITDVEASGREVKLTIKDLDMDSVCGSDQDDLLEAIGKERAKDYFDLKEADEE